MTLLSVFFIFFALSGYLFLQYQNDILSVRMKDIKYYYNAYTHTVTPQTTPAGTQAYAESVPILLYHGLLDKSDGLNVTLNNFTDQMLALHKAGYHTIDIEEFYDFMKGHRKLPDKSFILTFDDGRRDSYYPADPLLKKLGYKAVMYVIMNRLGKTPFYLSTDELQRMQASGRWELQSHGKNDHDLYIVSPQGAKGHFMSNKLWLDSEQRFETAEELQTRIYTDLLDAKKEMDDTFTINSLSYALPFGDFGQTSVNFPESRPIILDTVHSLYEMTMYQMWPSGGSTFNYPDPKTYMIKRIDVRPQWTGADLLNFLESQRARALPYSLTHFDTTTGWTENWGKLSFQDGTMMLGGSDTTGGGVAFLSGSFGWYDYMATATVNMHQGSEVAILGRFQDNDDFVGCNFGRALLHIDQKILGSSRVIKGLPYSGLPDGDFNIGIRVQNRNVQCFLNGKEIATTDFLDPTLSRGGVGIKVWDPVLNHSELAVKNISITGIPTP